MLDKLRVKFCVVCNFDGSRCFQQSLERSEYFVFGEIAIGEAIEVDNENGLPRCKLNQTQAGGKWIEICSLRVQSDNRLACESFNCFPEFIGGSDYFVIRHLTQSHQTLQHQYLPFVLRFVIDQVVEDPAQVVLRGFVVAFEDDNALEIFVVV